MSVNEPRREDVQNYREGSHPHPDASSAPAHPFEGSYASPRQVLGVILAAVLVAIVLSAFALLGARLTPGGGDCVLTDNAGCIETGSTGLAGQTAAGAELGRGS